MNDQATSEIASYFRRRTVRYLERYPTSERRFRDWFVRTCRKKYPDLEAAEMKTLGDSMVAFATEFGLLDDVRLAEALVRSYQRRAYSRRQMDAKLRAKGLPAAIIEHATAVVGSDDDLESAKAFLQKKRVVRDGVNLSFDDKRKLLAAMVRRGFGYSVAKQALESVENLS